MCVRGGSKNSRGEWRVLKSVGLVGGESKWESIREVWKGRVCRTAKKRSLN